MLMRFFLVAALCAAFPAHASNVAVAPLPPPPRLILSDTNAEPVQVQQLTIRSEISGGMAETTVRMVFFNPNRRQLEGNLQFPLADGQQVTAFALDINGEMRPAVPVDKARGRMVFEAIERRQVDPGLLEVTQGNNFKLRVYPIMPHASRTVELTYSEPLTRRGANWVYRLPLAYGAVKKLDLTVRVNDADARPALTGMGPSVQFAAVDGGHEATLSRSGFNAAGAIELVTKAHAEPRVYQQEVAGSTWFVAEIPVEAKPQARAAPRVIGLLWDSSGSGASRALNAELSELDTYFRALRNVEVRLTRLRDRPEATQVFKVQDGDWRALRRALEATVYDGASALNDWKPQASVDQYLLFSDGLSNYGGKVFPTLAAHQALFALNSALSADSARLAALAERNRGQFIAVNPATSGAAARALLSQDARIDDIRATGATDIEVDSRIVRGGLLRIAGRLVARQAKVHFTVTNGGNPVPMSVDVGMDAPHHPRAGATWAGYRLRSLEADVEIHRAEIGRIGRRFGIPTRETSLIVLEQMDDYVRYEIEPPASMMNEYKRIREMMAQQHTQQRKRHFDEVVRMFAERKTWWNRQYPKKTLTRRPAKRQQAKGSVQVAKAIVDVSSIQPSLRRPVPPPAPAPVPVAAPAADVAPQTVNISGSRLKMQVAEGSSPIAVIGAPASAPAPAPAVARELSYASDARAREGVSTATAKPAAPAQIGMQLKKWTSDAPYIARMNKAAPDKLYQVYLDQKPDYANSTAFFLDAADMLASRGQHDLSLRVLSNLAEMDLENRAILRILGYRLIQAGEPALAVRVFEQVKLIAIEEPQSFRDLGLALAASGRTQEAVDTLYEVVLRPWDQRFPDIETITLAEINALIATSGKRLDVSRIDKRLLASQPLDLRVVMTWDADNSDMDLYVTDPYGEICNFSNNRTRQGGRMSQDFTGGYGPEEYALRRAAPGKYKVEANFYGNRQQIIAGATTVQVKLTTGFGTRRQKEQLVTLRLKEQESMVFVGEFEVK